MTKKIAFENLGFMLPFELMPKHYDPHLTTVTTVDAFNFEVGAVISNSFLGCSKKLIAHASRVLT